MDTLSVLVMAAVAVVLVFDYTNGFHDTANMVASSVATRAMTPAQAIALVGTFTFLGPLLGGTAVAETVGQFVELDDFAKRSGVAIVLAGVAGAIGWNLMTWWRGLPSSSSHALIGGLCGAVLVAAGGDHVVWGWRELVEQGQLTGLSKIRWRTKQFGFRQLHLIVQLADGTWLVSEQADGASTDWRVRAKQIVCTSSARKVTAVSAANRDA